MNFVRDFVVAVPPLGAGTAWDLLGSIGYHLFSGGGCGGHVVPHFERPKTKDQRQLYPLLARYSFVIELKQIILLISKGQNVYNIYFRTKSSYFCFHATILFSGDTWSPYLGTWPRADCISKIISL